MKRFSRMILVALLCAALFVGGACASEVKLAIGGAEWAPYVYTEDGRVTGLFMELFEALGARSGIEFEVSMFPHLRMRSMISGGELDGEVFINPAWRGEYADESVYTVPVMEAADVVLMKRDQAVAADSVEDFAGKTIACVMGYYYPEGFSDAFDAGTVRRDNSPGVDAVPQKLAHDRVDAAIMDEIVAVHMFARYGFSIEDFVAVYTFQRSPFALRLRTEHEPLLPRLNEAIESMIADGTVEEILRKYRMEE